VKKFLIFVVFFLLLILQSDRIAFAATCAAEYTPSSNILTYTTITARVSNTTATHEYEVTLTKKGSSEIIYSSRLEAESDNQVLSFEIPLSEYPIVAGDYTFAARNTRGSGCIISHNTTIRIESASADRCPTFTGYTPYPATPNDQIILEFSREGQNASKQFIIELSNSQQYVLQPNARKLILGTFSVGTYTFTVSSNPGLNDCEDGVFDVSPPECKRDGQDCITGECCAGFKCVEESGFPVIKTCRPNPSPSIAPLLTPPCTENCVTALGQFTVSDVGKFIGQLFRFVLAIGGTGAVLLVIYAGFLFIVSRGDKEKIANARSVMTAAVEGLIFILLSFALLNFIAEGIFNLPGF